MPKYNEDLMTLLAQLHTLHSHGLWLSLTSWCITSFKVGPLGAPLMVKETWLNHKHSSTQMSIERGFGILKACFKEIGEPL